ncbi:MAG TPA: helix-turn-helix domain-containing protein [Solirubrobacterales bacterium]|nr:helix-turn-helix domain-containing protein [Solirubrobacterales bacterium]
MPANRPHVDREAKAAEILDAAESLLLRDGYEATTMASVARAAGISSNAVYWYFSSKDELLASVLRRRQERAVSGLKVKSAASLQKQALAVLAELDSIASLTAVVHERAEHSPAVAEVHEAFHARVDAKLREGFEAAGMAGQDAGMAAAALIAMVEGIHLHSPTRDASARNDLVLWVIQSFVDKQTD